MAELNSCDKECLDWKAENIYTLQTMSANSYARCQYSGYWDE